MIRKGRFTYNLRAGLRDGAAHQDGEAWEETPFGAGVQGMMSLDVSENLDGNIRYVLGRWTVWIKITPQFPNQRQDTKDRVDCVLE